MADIKSLGPALECNPSELSPSLDNEASQPEPASPSTKRQQSWKPIDRILRAGSGLAAKSDTPPPLSAPINVDNPAKADGQSISESLNLCHLKTLSNAKKTDFPSIDIIAVHGSREGINSAWTWGKISKDKASKIQPGSGKAGETTLEKPIPELEEVDGTTSAANASRPDAPAEAGLQTTPKSDEPNEKGVDADSPQPGNANETLQAPSAPQPGTVDEIRPETKSPQPNVAEEAVPEKQDPKRARSLRKPFSTDAKKTAPSPQDSAAGESSKKSESSSKRESRFLYFKFPQKKTESGAHEAGAEESSTKVEGPSQRGPPASRGADAERKVDDKKDKHSEATEVPQATPAKDPKKPNQLGDDASAVREQGAEPEELETVNWLQDDKMLPSTLPECRVLGFSYPFSFPSSSSNQDIALDLLAQKLLEAIEKKWEDDNNLEASAEQQKNDSSRLAAPIIFIGYELGGLIIEKALSIAATEDPNRAIAQLVSLTGAVMFFATPFIGSGSKESSVVNQLTSIAFDTYKAGLKLVRGGGPRQIQVQEVMHDNEGLQQLLTDFSELVKKSGIPVVSYTAKSPESNQPKPKAVDTEFETVELNKTAREIGKFPSRTDSDFTKVRATLTKFVERRQIHDAVMQEDDVLKKLLKAGLNVELEDEFGRTPLQTAVIHGRLNSVRLLLGQGGANISHRDRSGLTALHHAVKEAAAKGYQHEDAQIAKNLIKLLLEKGADIESTDNNDKTAWDLADNQKWLLDLKNHRALLKGASKALMVDLKEPTAPSTKEARTACQGFMATIMEFYYNNGGERYLIERASVEELVYNPNSGPGIILDHARDPQVKETPSCRWYHIPANNETWIKDLFAKLGVLVEPMHEHRHEGYTLHSRFMWPQAERKEFRKQKVTKGLVPNLTKPDLDGIRDMVLYVPFLSFETHAARKQMTRVMKQAQKKQKMPASRKRMSLAPTDPDQWYDENLIDAYYESLHPRRTLDQFYYYMLEDTEMRDNTQVVHRWAERQHRRHLNSGLGTQKPHPVIHVMMADQLWLWIIDDNTVVTGFAETWGEWHERGSFDVLERFINYMKRKDRPPIRSGHDLAVEITKHCVNAFNVCNPPGMKFHDAFESSINQAANEETDLFELFRDASEKLTSIKADLDSEERTKMRDDLFNITKETNQLKDVKDILDELNIVLTLLKEQKDVLSKVPKDFCDMSIVDSTVDNNIRDVEKMEEHAKNTYNALNHLLDLKQKQANAWEARFAREQSEQSARQGNIILLFTIVTIIFLPLSFMASFFALSIAQFPKDAATGQTNWQLADVSGYIFGISIATSITFILIALNANRVKEVWTRWGRGRGGGVRWAGFRTSFSFFGRKKLDRMHLHSDRLRHPFRHGGDTSYFSDNSFLMDWEVPHYNYMSSPTVWSRDQNQNEAASPDLEAIERDVGLQWRGTGKIWEGDEE